MHCPAAPRLEAEVEDSGSSFAEEGTLAHAYCAKKLKTFLGLPTDGEEAEIAALHDKHHSGEMDEYTDTYAALVLGKLREAQERTRDAQLLVETRLDFGDDIPDAFGTADAIIIADGMMEVIDFKYGKGVRVDATDNPQMMIYALGAYRRYSFDYNISNVRMTIVQPRIDNFSEFELSASELVRWAAERLRPAAEEAYSGNGPQQPGDWCQFCKVKSRCRALASQCLTLEELYGDKILSADELAKEVLPRLDIMKKWLSGVEEYALQQALAGIILPGWKVVEGRSVRRITDTINAAAALNDAGHIPADIYKPVELKGITDLERLVGKKRLAELCGKYIEKPTGKPTLVPESDKRPAINTAAEDFAGIND